MKAGLVLLTLIAIPCFSQTTGTRKAVTKGPCSPAVTGNNNELKIICQGIPDKLGAQLVSLLNRIANNETDTQAMMAKLDGCLAGAQENQSQVGNANSQVNQRSSGADSPNVSAPNGIAIGGGTVSNPTVNNYAPPQRHLAPDFIAKGTRCLSNRVGIVDISAIQGNTEAWNYAQDWWTMFRNAGWKLKDNIITSFMVGGGGLPLGTRASILGAWNDAAKQATYNRDSPEGQFVTCLFDTVILGDALVIIPYPDMEKGTVAISVYPQPSN